MLHTWLGHLVNTTRKAEAGYVRPGDDDFEDIVDPPLGTESGSLVPASIACGEDDRRRGRRTSPSREALRTPRMLTSTVRRGTEHRLLACLKDGELAMPNLV